MEFCDKNCKKCKKRKNIVSCYNIKTIVDSLIKKTKEAEEKFSKPIP